MPQDFGFYPGVNATELLNHFALLKGIKDNKVRKESVDYLLQQTNLWDVRKRSVADYSGGMRQRFGIAQALIGNPKIIIVDEPSAGLDPTERNRFLTLLGEIGLNKIVILSTHIVEDVYNLCSNMAIMNKGEVKLVLEKTGDKELIVTVIDANTFSVAEAINDKIFVYGKHVNDLLTVDYDAVSMLNVSATQELSKQIEQLKADNAKLQNRLLKIEASLQSSVNTITDK